MVLDNNIHNTVAGFVWLATGFAGTTWIGSIARRVWREVGGEWRYFFGPEPGSEARAKVVALQKRLWIFVAVWLLGYLILDWLF